MAQLVVFSHLRWNFVYQRPQHLLSRLARHHDVLVVEEPVRAPGEPRLETSEVLPRVSVARLRTAIDAPGFTDEQMPLLRALLAEHLHTQHIDDCVAWFYTPMALPLLAALPARAVVFDCMDELSAFKGAPQQLRERERALIAASDLVLTGGPSLYDAKRSLHPNVLCLPSAVDVDHYAPRLAVARQDAMEEAERIQRRVARPRLGWFGVIDERMDLDLLAALADADAQWQIVMVGPVVKIDPAALPRRPNIHWLGQQPYEILPQLVAGWDVCLLPFALNESTRFISPTKTLEYMAAEKPVVSTAVNDVVRLYGDVVRIGVDTPRFIAACSDALAEGPDAQALRSAAMRAVVACHTWDHAADQVRAALAQVLAGTRAAPIVRDRAEPLPFAAPGAGEPAWNSPTRDLSYGAATGPR